MRTTDVGDLLKPMDFFTYWSILAQTSPERFEKERNEAIEMVILSASPEHQEGLWRLQWRIDAERKLSKNPIDAMLRLQKMMWEQFYAEKGFIYAMNCIYVAHASAQSLSIKPQLYVVKKD